MSEGAVALDVRVLGVLQVVAPTGEPVVVGGDRQRAVLASLALAGPAGLSVERIIDLVWESEADDTHVGHVRTTISRLRRQLGGGTTLVATRPGGYRLDGDRVVVDAWTFEGLVDRARSAVAEDERGSLLATALELWRGEVVEDVGGVVAGSAAARGLTERRLDAEEELLGVLLRQGEHAHVASRAAALLAEHPYRERLRELEARALDSAGRTTEALDALRGHRERLVEDLGLELPRRLVELEHELLRGGAPGPLVDGGHLRGYELRAVLDRGATSVVHLARQPVLGRDVVLTSVWGRAARDPTSGRRLEQLTQRLQRTGERGLVPPVDAWREVGRLHLAEPFLPELPPVTDEREAARVVVRVGRALGALHELGLAHGAIDGRSVRLDPDGAPVLTGAVSAVVRRWSIEADERRERAATAARDVAALAALATPPTSTRDTDAGAAITAFVELLSAARSDAPVGLTELVEAAERVLAGPHGGVPSTAEPRGEARRWRNPYRGLSPFTAADAEVFAGREELSDEVAEALLSGRRLVVLTGPSGVGKSSLLLAGVLPTLERRGAGRGVQQRVLTLRPGDDPPRQLAAALGEVGTAPAGPAMAALAAGTGSWSAAVDEVARGAALVVAIDQLEELWPRDDRGRGFLSLLAELVEHPTTRVIASVRVDRLGPLLTHPRLGVEARRALWGVGPLGARDLEAAIQRPATRAGLAVEPGLVAALVSDMADNPTALPMLQLTLTTLADRSVDGALNLAAYDELGGLVGAIVERGEALVADTATAPDDVRRMFAVLTTVEADGQVTRRPERLAEVLAVVPGPVVDRAVEERLLTIGRDPVTREPVLDVSHEALFVEWPRLRDWLDEERDALRARTTLLAAAAVWEEEGRPVSRLLRGTALSAAGELLGAGSVSLPSRVRRFVELSVADEEERRRAEQLRRRRERQLTRIAAVAAVVSVVLAGVAFVQRDRAADSALASRTAALVRASESTAASEPVLSTQLATAAARLAATPATAAALATAVTTEPRVTALVTRFGATDCPGVAATGPGTVDLALSARRDTVPGVRVVSFPDLVEWRRDVDVPAACWVPSPAGDGVLGTSGTSVTMLARDPDVPAASVDGVLAATWEPGGNGIFTIVPDGAGSLLRRHAARDLAVADEVQLPVAFPRSVAVRDGVAVVLAPVAGPLVVTLETGDVAQLPTVDGDVAVAVPVGGAVVGATRDRLVRWDAAGDASVVPLAGTDPRAVVVTPDGGLAAVTTSVGVELVDLRAMVAVGQPVRVGEAAVAPFGADLLVVTTDGRALTIDPRGREPLRTSVGIAAAVGVAAGSTTAVVDGTRWWLVRDGEPVDLGSSVGHVVPLGDGRVLVHDRRSTTLRVVEADGRVVSQSDLAPHWPRAALGVLGAVADGVVAQWPSALGDTVVVPTFLGDDAAAEVDSVLVVDLSTGAVEHVLEQPELAAVAPSPDGGVVIADTAGRIRIEQSDGSVAARTEVTGEPTAVAAGWDRHVLVGLADGGVLSWTPGRDARQLARPDGDAVRSLATTDDGRVVVLRASGRLVVIDPTAPGIEAPLLGTGVVGGPVLVDGTTAHLVHDGEVVAVPLALGDWVTLACERAGAPLDATSWRAATGVDPPIDHPCGP